MKRTICLVSVGIVLAACSSNSPTSTGSTSGTTSASSPDNATTTATVASTVPLDIATSTPPAAPPSVIPTTTNWANGNAFSVQPWDPSVSVWAAGAMAGDPIVSSSGACQPFYDGLADAPYTTQRCGLWNAKDGQRIWTVTKGATGGFVAVIWQQIATNEWAPMLRTTPREEFVWTELSIRTGNIDSGANDELVVGGHHEFVDGWGSFDLLEMYIVDIRSGNPQVVAQYSAFEGIAVLRAGEGLELWGTATFESGPNPTQYYMLTRIVAPNGKWEGRWGTVLPLDDPALPDSEF